MAALKRHDFFTAFTFHIVAVPLVPGLAAFFWTAPCASGAASLIPACAFI
jgi:hypothetical protein